MARQRETAGGTSRPKRLTVSFVVGATLAVMALAAWVGAPSPPERAPGPDSGVTVRTFTPEADAYVSTAHPDVNYGARRLLRIQAKPKLTTYLRFSLTGLAGRITKVELRMWPWRADPGGYRVSIVPDNSWSEATITSRNAPAAGSVVATAGRVDAESWSTTTVTGPVTPGSVSLALLSATTGEGVYSSRESEHPPQLVVETKPQRDGVAETQGVVGWLGDVAAATASRFAVQDDRGHSMDSLKIAQDPAGDYLGVYHTSVRGRFVTMVASSRDLLRWTYRATLDVHAAQPTIELLPDRSYLVALEADTNGIERPARTWLRFRHYPSRSALLSGKSGRVFNAHHTLAPALGGAEGTPSIVQARLRPDLAHSTITIGFHYHVAGTGDRQAMGTLTNFALWTAVPNKELDAALSGSGLGGDFGDRDTFRYGGREFTVVEARASPGSAWQVFVVDVATRAAERVRISTPAHSSSFANPTVTRLRAPSGAPALAVTLFVPHEGAGRGEAGELVYYWEIEPPPPTPDPVVVAVGDIACRPGEPSTETKCRDKVVAELATRANPTAVLALGDLQYDDGSLANFLSAYDAHWGALRAITYPVPGNHEYSTPRAAGFYRYFGSAATGGGDGYYSFDIGAWHVIALNSECDEVGGCSRGSPQQRWLAADLAAHANRCVLAYWHQPRFSSGPHGSNPAYEPFWEELYAAGVDLVLNGHDHDYERFAPQGPGGLRDAERGIRQFVVGTGGKNRYRFTSVAPNSQVRNNDTFGLLQLTLHADSYDWRFVPEPGKSFTDAGSARCS